MFIAAAGRLALRALIPAAERDSAYTIAAPLMPALGAMFAILIALSLASEASFLASAQGIVSSESAHASRLAWAATSPGVTTAPIQSALRSYLQAARAYEWHGNAAAAGNDLPTAQALATLERAVRAQAARPALGPPPAPSCWPPSTPSPTTAGPA